MEGKNKVQPLIIFVVILIISIVGSRFGSEYILREYTDDYGVHSLFNIVANLLLAVISLAFIKRYDLIDLAGLSRSKKLVGLGFLIFPLYLVVINVVFSNDIPMGDLIYNCSILLLLCLSIGLAEELSLRGFLQSYIIKYFTKTKKQAIWAVIGGALIFGLLHLIKFDKGFYGEVSQVFFATFIGVMFGAILLRVKRIWPLIIIHALIDFAAKMDEMGHPFQMKNTEPTEFISAIVITLIVLPCLIYGLVILRKPSREKLMA